MTPRDRSFETGRNRPELLMPGLGGMCKHVAATLYAVKRLIYPELLLCCGRRSS
jgi:hypothetical protein